MRFHPAVVVPGLVLPSLFVSLLLVLVFVDNAAASAKFATIKQKDLYGLAKVPVPKKGAANYPKIPKEIELKTNGEIIIQPFPQKPSTKTFKFLIKDVTQLEFDIKRVFVGKKPPASSAGGTTNPVEKTFEECADQVVKAIGPDCGVFLGYKDKQSWEILCRDGLGVENPDKTVSTFFSIVHKDKDRRQVEGMKNTAYAEFHLHYVAMDKPMDYYCRFDLVFNSHRWSGKTSYILLLPVNQLPPNVGMTLVPTTTTLATTTITTTTTTMKPTTPSPTTPSTTTPTTPSTTTPTTPSTTTPTTPSTIPSTSSSTAASSATASTTTIPSSTPSSTTIAPITNTTTLEPIANTTLEPIANTTMEPATNTSTLESATNTSTLESATNTSTLESATNTTLESATNTSTLEPATNTTTLEPAINTSTQEPDTNTSTPESATNTTTMFEPSTVTTKKRWTYPADGKPLFRFLAKKVTASPKK